MASTKELFSKIETKYRLPEGYLSRVYQLESRGGKDNFNEKSGAAGPFQFMPKTAKSMGLSDPYDIEASAEATAKLAAQNRTYLEQHGVENPDGKVLYLAHQQGAAGAVKLLGSGDTSASSALGTVYNDPKVAAKAVSLNGGEPDMPSRAFADKVMAKYEGDTNKLRPYSALGETPPIDKTAKDSPLAAPNTADVLEESAPEEDRGSSRKESYAMNALLSASNALQQQPEAPMLLIPRLSYAKGGIVDLPQKSPKSMPEQVSEVAQDLASIAIKERIDIPHLAYLLMVSSGMYMPHDRAVDYAQQIMNNDVNGLMQRFQKYKLSAQTFARLNEMMGGKHDFLGSGHLGPRMKKTKGEKSLQWTKKAAQSVLDSEVVKSRPVMDKALRKIIERI
jgi:hypothetical protein